MDIMAIVTLGYLGLGIAPPTAEWGSMIIDGQEFITTQWRQATIPGIAVVVTSLGLSLLGDGLSDLLTPRGGSDRALSLARVRGAAAAARHRPAHRHPAPSRRGHRHRRRRLLEVAAGERFGIVGESGSGKSLTLRAIAGLLPKGVEVLSGSSTTTAASSSACRTSQRRR